MTYSPITPDSGAVEPDAASAVSAPAGSSSDAESPADAVSGTDQNAPSRTAERSATLRLAERKVGDRLVATVELHRPAAKNAMTLQMAQEMRAIGAALAGRRDVAAVVVQGAGGAFCSGADLSWLADRGEVPVAELRRDMRWFYESFLAITQVPVPVIAAVEGPAIGAGMAVAAAADLRVVAAGAKVGAPFTSLGLHPGMACTATLPHLLGASVAADVLLTGRVLSGAECGECGFASRVVADGAATEVAAQMADAVARTAPVATDLTLQALRAGKPSVSAALNWEALAQPVTMRTEDAAEGLRAKAERRRPTFTGT